MFRPWVFLVIAFLLVITAWTTFIVIAVRNPPQRISISAPAR